MLKRNKDRGFTLIELVVAIVVISIAVSGLLVTFSNIIRATVQPEVINISTHLAEQEMERETALRFSSVANVASTNFGGSFSAYSFQVAVSAVPAALANDPGMANYKQVLVTVTHTSGVSLSLTSVVTNT